MNKNKPTDQAFPSDTYPVHSGINIRLYIATMMMQGLLANQSLKFQVKELAEAAYMVADELLKQQQPEE